MGIATIGANIKRLRLAAGFTRQGAFASAIGVPQPRLSDWENDRYGLPETGNLLRIAKILKVSIDALLVGVDDEYDRARANAEPQERTSHVVVSSQDSHHQGSDPSFPITDTIRQHIIADIISTIDTLHTSAIRLESVAKELTRRQAADHGASQAISAKRARRHRR